MLMTFLFDSPAVQCLFQVLHASYGTLFSAKFCNGIKNPQGQDEGMLLTMKIWCAELAGFEEPVIAQATKQMIQQFADFPPNLPQFINLCHEVSRMMNSNNHAPQFVFSRRRKPDPVLPYIGDLNAPQNRARYILECARLGYPKCDFAINYAFELLRKYADLSRQEELKMRADIKNAIPRPDSALYEWVAVSLTAQNPISPPSRPERTPNMPLEGRITPAGAVSGFGQGVGGSLMGFAGLQAACTRATHGCSTKSEGYHE